MNIFHLRTMCRKTFIVLLLCVAMLFPSIVSAQESIWSRQKIAIASISDRTERGLDENYKRSIYAKIRDILVTNFDTFEVNIDDVKNQLRASNLPPSPQNIRKKIGERGADFIVFTEIRATSSAYDAYNANAQIIIILSQHRIVTGKEVSRTITVSPNKSAVTGGVGQLISELFGVSTSGQSASQNTYNPQPTYESAKALYKKGLDLYNQKQYTEAINYFKRAAELDYATAQYSLGYLYEGGRGVTQNYNEAVMWYQKAAENGLHLAKERLAELEKEKAGIFFGLNLFMSFRGGCVIDAAGIYKVSDVLSKGGLYYDLGNSFNRSDFGISVDFYPRPNTDPIMLSLSTGWRIFHIELINGTIYITTNNHDNYYDTGIRYESNQWQTLNVRYKNNGTVVVYYSSSTHSYSKILTNVNVDESNGDNVISWCNYSNGEAYNGLLRGLKIYN